MKRYAVLLAVLCTGALLWFWMGDRLDTEAVGPVKKAQTSVVVSEPAKAVPVPPRRKVYCTDTGEVIFGREEFKKRFGLTDIEEWDLSSSIWSAALVAFNEKGRGAQVVSVEGKNLTLFIPGLKYRPGQIEEEVQKALLKAVAPEKAHKAWDDPQGRRYLLALSWIALATADSVYHFTRVADATFDEVGTRIDYPKFTIEIEHAASRDAFGVATEPETWRIEDFTFSDVESHGLSWPALAKAPTGYFRDEPIGEPPPRQAQVVVIRELDTGKVEIRNLRYPGSKDFDQIEPEVSGKN